MTVDLRPGDNRRSLRRMIAEGEFVDSVVCDPPYGLVSVAKRFGAAGAAPAKFGTDGAFSRQSRGFMGKLWDGTGIERDPEFWRLVWEVMKPGAYIVAFSSSRTYGYMQVAMEAAGFITHPMFGWVFNTGFPKGHDPKVDGYEGWKTGTQSLKPALEPVYFGQKPFSEKTGALNILEHGVGAVNIDACRVPAVRPAATYSQPNIRGGQYNAERDKRQVATTEENLGRYPANLVHDGSSEVVALFPQSGGQQGDLKGHDKERTSVALGDFPPALDAVARGDTGSAARFFNSFPHEGPIMCHPKAGKTDRAGSGHATVKPVGLMRHYARLITPPGGLVLDPFAGSGTTGQAALAEGMRCILMEAEHEYIRDICRRFDLSVPMATRLWQIGDAM